MCKPSQGFSFLLLIFMFRKLAQHGVILKDIEGCFFLVENGPHTRTDRDIFLQPSHFHRICTSTLFVAKLGLVCGYSVNFGAFL